ncbi:MAG: PQQ-binding-like beta-propeller repeat protein, partial [Caldisericia bacterium]|nr:PQQ-binding-like beta-propeller repeat protein [Caldisericia bacterium]
PNFTNITLPQYYQPGKSSHPNIPAVPEEKLPNTNVLQNAHSEFGILSSDEDSPPEETPFYFHGFKGNSQHTGYIHQETSHAISMLWRYPFYGDYITDIQTYGDVLYFADHSGYIHAISKKDASVLWKYPLEEKRYVVGIDISATHMYVTYGPIFSRRGIEDDSCLLYAVDLQTGKELWSKRIEQVLVISPPLADGKDIFISTGKMNSTFSKTMGGDIHQISESGEIIQTLSIEDFAFWGDYLTKSGSIIMGGAIRYDQATRTIVFPHIYAFDLETQRQIWTVKPLGENGFLGTPSVKDDYMYITENPMMMGRGRGGPANESWLQKIHLQTGKLEKSMRFSEENFGRFAPTLAQDAIYLCSFTGRMYCINYNLEKFWWEKRFDDRFSYFTELMASKNYLYTILYEGDFLCIDKSDGSIKFRYATGSYGRMPVVTGEEVFVSGNVLYCFSENALPILFVEPSSIIIGETKQGDTVQRQFQIVWTGTDVLEGSVAGAESWMQVTPQKITQNIQTFYLTMDTSALPNGATSGQVLISTNKGKKTIDVEIHVIVPQPLTIQVNIPLEGIVTKEKEFTIEGETEPFTILEINSLTSVAYANGYFYERLRLQEGENPIEIKATAKDGRQAYFRSIIIKDSIPPFLEVDLPMIYETTSKTFQVCGKTEPGVKLKIGSEEVPLEGDGSFEYQYTMTRDDELLRIRSIDAADNITQVKIQLLYTGK